MGTRQRTNAERRRKANAKNQRNLLNKLSKGGFEGFEKEKTFKTVQEYFAAKQIQSAEQNAALAAEHALLKAEKNKNRPGRLLRKKSDRIAAQTKEIKKAFVIPTGYDRVPRKLKKQLVKQAA